MSIQLFALKPVASATCLPRHHLLGKSGEKLTAVAKSRGIGRSLSRRSVLSLERANKSSCGKARWRDGDHARPPQVVRDGEGAGPIHQVARDLDRIDPPGPASDAHL